MCLQQLHFADLSYNSRQSGVAWNSQSGAVALAAGERAPSRDYRDAEIRGDIKE